MLMLHSGEIPEGNDVPSAQPLLGEVILTTDRAAPPTRTVGPAILWALSLLVGISQV